jgi:hypothetical protein
MASIEEIKEAIASLDAMIAATGNLIGDGIPSVDRNEVAEVAVQFNNSLAAMKDVFAILSSDAISQLEYTPEPIEVEGGSVEIKAGSSRKAWDHERLASVVAKRIHDSSVDLTTGEVLMTTEQMIQEILKYAAVSYWRVGALKELDLTADNYCEVSEPKTNLVIKRK